MKDNIIKEISDKLKINEKQVINTLKLLESDNTIPFIARYRKEMTGNLHEEQLRNIEEVYNYQLSLLKRKEEVIKLIEEKGMMTENLKKRIMFSKKLVEVEDLYRPYQEKRKTKATEAIKKGLKPLAQLIMSFPIEGSLEGLGRGFLNKDVKTVEEAFLGAKYIISEEISDNAGYRSFIRRYTYFNGVIITKKKKNAQDETKIYEMYYDFKEEVKDIKSHRILAINRGERESILTVKVDVLEEEISKYLEEKIIKNNNSFVVKIVKEAIEDGYKRLIKPSIEREIRKGLTVKGEEVAIEVFSKNLERLLLQPPLKDKVILGFDPAFRTGCKLAVIDSLGIVLEISIIFPHEPQKEIKKSEEKLLELVKKYQVNVIAIGNGTASRESEEFISNFIKRNNLDVSFIIVDEAGASVYSASKLAIKEFPHLQVEERSAISIARRLLDPLSELVKIDPKSIGVGQYQHDVSLKELEETLKFVVSKVVNQVGVDINTASESLLNYISGMNKGNIKNLIKYREKKGFINNRNELKEIKGMGEKTYEQAIGFLRIIDGDNPLDKTNIHPESYVLVLKLLEKMELLEERFGSKKMIEVLNKIDINQYLEYLKTDYYTLEGIIKSLQTPLPDPRDKLEKPLLRKDILKLEDLSKGMKLQGTVRNVVDFGVFIDIGLKDDGLVHISKLSNQYVKHPLDIVQVGDIVDCYVDEILKDKKKVSLSLLKP
ncbi:MAG: Tex family protein [Bacilli bacterium]|jgi:uncharacterized protein